MKNKIKNIYFSKEKITRTENKPPVRFCINKITPANSVQRTTYENQHRTNISIIFYFLYINK